jgi:hypothetical protein
MSSTPYCCHIEIKHEFSGQIFEKYSNIKLMEISLVRAELFHVDGRTDMRKLIVAFRSFAIAPIKDQKQLTHDPCILFITIIIIFQQSWSSITLSVSASTLL